MFYLLILFILYALFASAESAFVSCDVIRLRWLGSKGANFTLDFLKDSERWLASVLVGTNLTMVAISILGARAIQSKYGITGEMGAPFIITFIILIFGEIIPKAVGLRFSLPLSLILSRIFTGVYWIFFPLIWFVITISRTILSLFKLKAGNLQPMMKRDEFKIALSEVTGREKKMLLSIMDFSEKRVKDIMVPRHKICAVPLTISMEKFLKVVRESGHSRIPVFDGSLDNIVGIVYVKDILGKQITGIRNLIQNCKFVPEYKKITGLMREMKREYRWFAIVKDEYGGTSGIVTLEDGMEELFGEIRDEYDSLEEVVQKISESEFSVSGGARLDEIERETGISLGPGYNTISASVQEKLDRIPKVGASIEIEGVKVTVISMKGRRIEKIRLEKNLTQEKSCDIIK